ncbi:MAG: 2,4-dienoyl-CoA reductase-like NADH-dependent reductase (Old Yellow Enzyme family), partial [Patiriisocius sp.]
MTDLLSPLGFTRGPEMKNRFMLAPLTNQQSHADGSLSDEEYTWLTKRAEGGFGLTMTCAAHVQAIGQGFPGQLGVFGNQHLPGLKRLAENIKSHNSIAICQIHHAGIRSPVELIGEASVGASADDKTGSRALSLEEVHQLRDDFVAAAVRCEHAGFDGVELHGAHSYIICQFLSAATNRRDDEYGGSTENRNRLLLEIIDGIRASCIDNFMLGVRLSPERFGLKLTETTALAAQLMQEGKIDFLDMSLWDVFKEPEETEFKGRTLMSYFAELDRGNVRLGVAGKIRNPAEAEAAMQAGIDWIMLGRAAILHHNFPALYAADQRFKPIENPV